MFDCNRTQKQLVARAAALGARVVPKVQGSFGNLDVLGRTLKNIAIGYPGAFSHFPIFILDMRVGEEEEGLMDVHRRRFTRYYCKQGTSFQHLVALVRPRLHYLS